MEAIKNYENELYSFFESKYSTILDEIRTKKEISDDLKGSVTSALDELKNQLGDLT